jgi:hypothetical protein
MKLGPELWAEFYILISVRLMGRIVGTPKV